MVAETFWLRINISAYLTDWSFESPAFGKLQNVKNYRTMTQRILNIIIFFWLPVGAIAQNDLSIDSTYKFMIYTLQIGSSFEIIRDSRGCFHRKSDTLQIYRTNDGLYANIGCKTIMLNGNSLENYRKFEFELLNNAHNGGCTTVENYSLRTNSFHVLLVSDNSCQWRGFDKYIMTLK